MAVLDFFGMFDYASGDDDTYKYSSEEFSELIEGVTGTGVSANTLDCFRTTANGVTLTVYPGVAFIKGRYGSNHSAKEVKLSATTSTTSRYDRLVLQLDLERRVIEMVVVSGVSASASPSIPALIQNELIYQMPLYLCLVSKGSTVSLIDERQMTYSASQIQRQLEERALLGHTHVLSEISGISLNTTASNIKMNGTQSAGSGTSVAKANHVHPVDTSRAAASHTHALGDVTGISLSSTAPKMNGTASAGSSTAVARYDHVHPIDTSRAAASHKHSASDINNLTASKGSSGGIYYHKSADGLIVQWGTVSATEQCLKYVDLPLSFSSSSSYVVMVTPRLLSGVNSTAYNYDTNTIAIGLSANSGDVDWVAIGY